MTPVEKRTAEEALEEPQTKVQKTEEETEEAPELVEAEDVEDDDDEDEDEDEDEDDDEEFDEDEEDDEGDLELDDEIPQEFTMEDFNDVEGMSQEMLDKFQAAFDAFVAETQEMGDKEEKEPMTLEDPAKLRPIPQTIEDLREKIVVAMLPVDISERRQELCQNLEAAPLKHLPEEDDLSDLAEEKMMEMLSKVNTAKLEVINNEITNIEKQEDKSNAFYHALILMDCVFDIDAGIFGDGHDCEAGKKMLDRFASVWKGLFAVSDETLKIDARLRGGVEGYLKSSIAELVKGDYTMEGEKNEFENYTFNFTA